MNNLFGKGAKGKLLEGIELLEKAVGSTLGPKGHTCVIHGYDTIATKDGVSVARAIKHDDPFIQAAINIFRQIADRTCDDVGDGTTTATVLGSAFIEVAYRLIEDNKDVNWIADELDKINEAVKSYIKDNKRDIVLESDDIYNVAMVASNYDKEISNLVSDAYKQVGERCSFVKERAKDDITRLKVSGGFEIAERGVMNQYYINNVDKGECVLENPYVILYDGTISDIRQVSKIMDKLSDNDSLLLICDDLTDFAESTFIQTSLKYGRKYCAIKAPALGNARLDIMKDIEAFTGSTYLSKEMGMNLDSMSQESYVLGQVSKCIVDNNKTIIVNNNVDNDKVDLRLKEITSQITNAESAEMIAKYDERFGNLCKSVVTIYLGAKTDSEYKERFDRLEDVIGATAAAVKGGIVQGGSMSLFRTYESFTKHIDDDLSEALLAPLTTMIKNAEKDPDGVFEALHDCTNFGYDVANLTYVDLFKAGIVDPANVVLSVVENAISITKVFMNTNSIILS